MCLLLCSTGLAQDVDDDPQAALVKAIRNDDAEAVQKAIEEAGADIDAKGGGGQTPLVFAVLMGKLESVKVLLKLGADVTIPEKDGYTVMHAAGFQGRAEVLKELASHGIDTMEQHKDGYYPIHRACWGRELRHTETVRTFLDLGVPVDLKAGNGKTCLSMTKNPETWSMVAAAMEAKESEL
eukprot:CAMPEP_0176001274 /NCGR_PEP_ID=MMETSP0120_2-20121206/37_1 /TAXON_ID=160619 /ORGANISM="Kryptoperidinium foliaceum, Strain CCMP 1326" /LENGTH=181 /DNA_ID=CAMNT_0017333807 /DNA_START=147 /DNA_END=692 /DNA_ORIENTATION=-